MPSTALTIPSSVVKCTERSRTSRRATERRSFGRVWGRGGLVHHARIEEGIHHVHNEVQRDDEERAHEDGPLDRRQVALLDRVERQSADAREVEDGLREDRAAEQDPEVEAEDGDDRRDRRSNAVLEDDDALLQALGPGCSYVVLGHRREEIAPQEAGIDGGER